MPDYKDMYFNLFSTVTDTIDKAKEIIADLENATRETEEMYMSDEFKLQKGEDE